MSTYFALASSSCLLKTCQVLFSSLSLPSHEVFFVKLSMKNFFFWSKSRLWDISHCELKYVECRVHTPINNLKDWKKGKNVLISLGYYLILNPGHKEIHDVAIMMFFGSWFEVRMLVWKNDCWRMMVRQSGSLCRC